MNLKRIIEQQEMASQYYDLGKDFFSFTHAMDSASEAVKNKFELAIASKIKGKKIRARASRGYKQFEKDYEINVANVSIDDYYDNYVVVVKSSNNKEYFLKPGFKVQVLGPMEAEKPEEPKQQPPAKPPEPTPTPAPQQPAAPPSQVPQAQEQPPMKEAEVGGNEIVRPYPVEKIEQDLNRWLVPMLPNRNANLKQFIPRSGVSRTKGRKTITSYAVTIPVEEVPALSVEQIKQTLSSATSRMGEIDTIYSLEKFDTRGDKYVIIVKKVTNY